MADGLRPRLSVIRPPGTHPALGLLNEVRERVLAGRRREEAFAHVVERTRVMLEALAELLEDQKAGPVQRNVQHRDRQVGALAFIEVVIQVAAALDILAEQSR